MTRTCLYEAANALMTRNLGGSELRNWALAIANRTGPRKAKVALARRLAVMLADRRAVQGALCHMTRTTIWTGRG
jgi:hypothetical protein